MKIYNYDAEGAFVSEGEARPDPLDEGRFLIPAKATPSPPPEAGQNQAAVFENDTWILKDDFRGTRYWTDAYTSVVIETIGEVVPEGAITAPPPSDLHVLVDGDWQAGAKYATLAEAKAMVIQYATAFEQHVTGPVSLGEQLSYDAKAAAAVAHMTFTATAEDTALLQAEADQTGETLNDLAQKIIDNAVVFRMVAGTIAGLRRATNEALEAVTDPNDYQTVLLNAQAQADALAVSLGLEPMAFDV